MWATGAAVQHPDGTDRAPRMLFQAVPEAKTVKNRVHLDLRPGRDPTRPRWSGWSPSAPPGSASGTRGRNRVGHAPDPEGNELCVPVPPGPESHVDAEELRVPAARSSGPSSVTRAGVGTSQS